MLKLSIDELAIQVPRYALSGQTVHLTCNFSLPNNKPFYSLKVQQQTFLPTEGTTTNLSTYWRYNSKPFYSLKVQQQTFLLTEGTTTNLSTHWRYSSKPFPVWRYSSKPSTVQSEGTAANLLQSEGTVANLLQYNSIQFKSTLLGVLS